VFIDGPDHDRPEVAAQDKLKRDALEDAGFRVTSISYKNPMRDQITQHRQPFGPGQET